MEEGEQYGNLGFINIVVLFEAGESSGIRNAGTRLSEIFTLGGKMEERRATEELLKINWENQKSVRSCK